MGTRVARTAQALCYIHYNLRLTSQRSPLSKLSVTYDVKATFELSLADFNGVTMSGCTALLAHQPQDDSACLIQAQHLSTYPRNLNVSQSFLAMPKKQKKNRIPIKQKNIINALKPRCDKTRDNDKQIQ